MKPPFVVLSIVAVLLLGAVPIFFGTGFLLVDELNNYQYTKHLLNSAADFFFIAFPMSFALLAVVTSIGLVQLRAWARKLLIFLATVPVLGCATLVFLRPKWIFPPSQPFSQNCHSLRQRMAAEAGLLEFARAVAELRRNHPVFRRRRFFLGPGDGSTDGPGDIAWFTPSGREMKDADWKTGYAKAMGVFLNGDAITEPDPRGQPVRDDSFLLLFSADGQPARFTLPGPAYGLGWEVLIDTASDSVPGQPLPGGGPAQQYPAGAPVLVAPRSMVVLRRTGTPAQPR